MTPGGATENSDEFSNPPDYQVVIVTSPWRDHDYAVYAQDSYTLIPILIMNLTISLT